MLSTLLAQAAAPQFATGVNVGMIIIVGIGIVLVAIVTTAIACTLLNVISKQQRAERELQFKRELLDRGLSADDITKLIEATPLPSDGLSRYFATRGKKQE